MKRIIIGDMHLGVKDNAQWFLKYQLDYMDEVFDYMSKENITEIIQLGDFWDSRKVLNVNTYHWVKKRILDMSKELGFKWYIIQGNHDTYYTHSNEVTSLSILEEYDNVEIIDIPTLIKNDKDIPFSLVPWISNDDDLTEIKKFYKDNPHDYTFGHFEIRDFEVVPGHKFQDGITAKFFENFAEVFSGHFHLKQKKGNINYMGTPYQITWSDFGYEKGFYEMDFSDMSYKYVKNENPIYKKIFYEETKYKELIEELPEDLENKIIKIFVLDKKKESIFTNFIYEIEKRKPVSFAIVENTDDSTESFVNDENKTIYDIIDDYLTDIGEENPKITKLLKKIYNDVVTE